MSCNQIDILLVEDNESDAEMTVRVLAKNNIANRILHVTDGAAAIDYLFAKGEYSERKLEYLPKLILLDLKMPKVNGIEVLEKIKTDSITKKIPVVVLTSSKEDPDIKKCYELGVNSYVVKPVDFLQFQQAITSLGFYWLITNQNPH